MGVEIERKFLVVGDAWRQGSGTVMRQGYLSSSENVTVRVRIAGSESYLTIKGPPVGITRSEFEYPIPVPDAMALLAMCDGRLIEKRRFIVPHAGQKWEVDEFGGANTGLVVAEIELTSPEQSFGHPDWLGAEVTHDPRFLNANLARHPFSRWQPD